MLAKPQRLARDKDFEKIFKSGKSFYAKLLGVKTIANQLNLNRYGVIISSKVSKKAVARNRLKRQLSQILSKLDKSLILGNDLAIIALAPILNQKLEDVEGELKKVLQRLKLLK